MRQAARIDANQPEIISALEATGCSVQVLTQVGDGCPDILVARNGRNELMEIKSEDGRVSARQDLWSNRWRAPVYVVQSIEDALDAMNKAFEAMNRAMAR